MFLIVLGSIGFPVLLELKAYIKNRVTNFRFSLFTKITTTTYLFLFLFGVIVVLILEHSNAFKGLSWHQSLFYALFQSSTTRSKTIDVSHFSDATNIVMGLLMFIGSSPSSRRWNQNNNICYFNFVLLLILIILVTKQVLKFSTEKYILWMYKDHLPYLLWRH